MSYAIIKSGGKQYNVEEGEVLRVATIDEKQGAKIELDALLVGDGKTTNLDGGKVSAKVIGHGRAKKIIVFKKKRRKQYKRTQGHRQNYTEIKIEKI